MNSTKPKRQVAIRKYTDLGVYLCIKFYSKNECQKY